MFRKTLNAAEHMLNSIAGMLAYPFFLAASINASIIVISGHWINQPWMSRLLDVAFMFCALWATLFCMIQIAKQVTDFIAAPPSSPKRLGEG
jgi:hypothetical protein